MSREIKFRGKSYKTGEWLHGDLLHVDGKPLISDPSAKIGFDKAFVDPETVGQYIGLKDRNGKEIYEGDILMFHPERPEVLQEFHVISYCDDYGFCQIEYYDKEDHRGNIQRYKREFISTIVGVDKGTIIGNLIDNPDKI